MPPSESAEEPKEPAECDQGAAAAAAPCNSMPSASGEPCGGRDSSVSLDVKGMVVAKSVAGEETVRLISSEGKALEVPVHIAEECELLKRLLSGSFAESKTRVFQLQNIRHNVLCKAIEYLRRRHQWREDGGAPLEFEIETEMAVDLLIAADYLGMK
ncbi:elongin c, putative [Eimeria maxima]|uniref:Elongin-C n=1 Tax=Eimeria maxima TaxID=5804 RepID=U6M8F2_EIMMA|nr:elongin c, putative [Eimeria maxima]CDJ60487.1 elongin c, putative [Eimeria maxima]